MERKLGTIERILDIQPIPDADAIEVATIRGWQVVVRKGEFKVGDMVIYFEIDSMLPLSNPNFEFLRLKPDQQFARIKTKKLRGQVSQGIAFPLSILPLGFAYDPSDFEGMDVTVLFAVEKYEPVLHASLRGKAKGNFPSFISKTDEERIQNIRRTELDKYIGQQIYISEKLDGTSATFYLYNGHFGVCSRNLELIETEDNTYWKIARKYNIEKEMRDLDLDGYAIQGEIIGPGIQKNRYGLNEPELFVFRIYNIRKSQLVPADVWVSMAQILKLRTVPLLGQFVFEDHPVSYWVNEIAEGKSVLNPKTEREGVVVKSTDCSFGFKVISNKFLLKCED